MSQYIKMRERSAREDPHLCGPHADQYRKDTVAMARDEAEWEVALNKVYGPRPAGQPDLVSDLWNRRYPKGPYNKKRFRKWFYEHYPHN